MAFNFDSDPVFSGLSDTPAPVKNPVTPTTQNPAQSANAFSFENDPVFAGLSAEPVNQSPGITPPAAAINKTTAQPTVRGEMRSYEPSIFDRIMDFFPDNKARASNELTVRKIAEREDVGIDQTYRDIGFGAVKPMLNPEGRAPVRAAAEGSKIFIKRSPTYAVDTANAVLRTVRGGDTTVDDSGLDELVNWTTTERDPDYDMNYDAVYNAGSSLGFSLATMASAATTYAGVQAATGNPVAATVAGMTASGATAFRASKDQFLSSAKEMLDKQSMEVSGRPINQEEWDTALEEFNSEANKYGAWEAIPEAVSNIIFVKTLAAPLKGVGKSGLAAVKEKASRVVADYLKTQATETGTETITAMGQSRAEANVGLRDESLSLSEAVREVLPSTVLLTSVMNVGGASARYAAGKFGKKPGADKSADDAMDILGNVETAEDVLGGVDPEASQPAGIQRALPAPVVVVDKAGVARTRAQDERKAADEAANREILGSGDPVAIARDREATAQSGYAAREKIAQRLPENLPDARLARDQFRNKMESLVTTDFLKGGGVAATIDPSYQRGESDGDLAQPITGRTPSLNPEWAQALLAETGATTDEVGKAVTKALAGERLGMRQARIVTGILDHVSERRNSAETLQYMARERDNARHLRRVARGELPSQSEYDQLSDHHAGSRMQEQEYPAHWDGEVRSLYEILNDAVTANAEETDRILTASAKNEWSTMTTVQMLQQRVLNGGGNAQQDASGSVEQGAIQPQEGIPAAVQNGVGAPVDVGTGQPAINPEQSAGIPAPGSVESGNQAQVAPAYDLAADPVFAGLDQANEGRRHQAAPVTKEQRKNPARRTEKRTDEMTLDEAREALRTSDKNVLRNERAYNEDERLEHQAFFDVDDFKNLNDKLTYAGGDLVIDEIGRIMAEEAIDAVIPYHLHGDEFIIQSNDEQALTDYSNRVQSKIKSLVLKYNHPNGSLIEHTGIGVSYGVGSTKEQAESRLKADKKRRQQSGQRSGIRNGEPAAEARGELDGTPDANAEGNQDRAGRTDESEKVAPAKKKNPAKSEDSAAVSEPKKNPAKKVASEKPIDPIQHALDTFTTKEKYISYLSGRLGKAEFAKQKDAIEQQWNDAHPEKSVATTPEAPKVTESVKSEAQDIPVERYQWMRNKEGGQGSGNQTEIYLLTESLFNDHIKSRVTLKDFTTYQKKYPDVTHLSMTSWDGGKTWNPSVPATGSLEEVRPQGNAVDKGWVKKVDTFDSVRAKKQAETADSEAQAAQAAIKSSDIPKADQIKLAADLRKGDVTPEDVHAMLDVAPKKESAIDAALRSVGVDPNAPPDKAKELRREAEKLMKESAAMLAGIPPGQPVQSTRHRNLLDKSRAKADKASELYRQADDVDAAKVASDAADATDTNSAAKDEPVTAQPEQVQPAADIAYFTDVSKRLYSGNITLDEYKPAFELLTANKEAITNELMSLTKDELLKKMGGMSAARYKNDKKADVAHGVYVDMLETFVLGSSFQFGMGKNAHEGGVRNVVNKQTDESLKEFSEKIKKQREKYKQRMAETVAGAQDPVTLDDHINAIKLSMSDGMSYQEARMALTIEQRARFDELTGEATRKERATRKESQQEARVRAPGEEVGTSEIINTKHTKLGHDLWQFDLDKRVEPDEFKALVAQAKQLGGNYSSYRGGGAIPGWQFRTEESAKAFKTLIAGDTTAAKEVMQARRDVYADDRSQSAVERLNEMADKLDENADDALAADRKTNTSRRARFAASAKNSANRNKAMAQTMRNIANGIENENAKFLDRIRTKSQVEMLSGLVSTAQSEQLRLKYPSYADYEKHLGEAPTMETADYVNYPAYTLYRSDLARLGRELVETEGTKRLGQSILNVADDTSDAYLKFAKENLDKVNKFRKRDGSLATFSSKREAEASMQGSGLAGKAMVLTFKRNEHLLVLSPSEAIVQKVWDGDTDKRITLNKETGAEIVEKIGKAARRGSKISVPWQFDNAYDKLKRLASMNIETPAELRAAAREFIALREAPAEESKIKKMERAMVGRAKDGLDFFPTPAATADQMIETADIQEGMSVLEPSAGMGHIAERIREAGVDPDVIEMESKRYDLLEAKGFNVIGRDFMDVTEGQYDRIIMNPPFSDGRDAIHVQHAYELLKPGGRLVAIMGEGSFYRSDKKATAFRDWLDSVGGTSEKLDEGTFLDSSLPVNTGVNARMVVIEKLEAKFSKGQSSANTHTVTTLKAAMDKAIKSFGYGMDKLLDTGKVKIVTGAEAEKIINKDSQFSKAQTETPAFKKWFGDSKVVNEHGRPLVVYHGTGADITEFDPSKTSMIDGVFLTPDSGYANNFARGMDQLSGNGNVMPLYVSLQNPRYIKAGNYNLTNLDAAMSDHKHDGVIVLNEDKSIHVVISRKSNQIKSAIGNRGTFDAGNPDIRYSKDGNPLAFFSPADGITYFIADNINKNSTDAQIRGLILHEIGVHALNLNRDSAEFKNILKQLQNMRKLGNKKVQAAYARANEAGTAEQHMDEEALGYLVEGNPDISIVQKFINWMKSIIRSVFPGLKFNDSELVQMARDALKAAPELLAGNQAVAGDAVMASKEAWRKQTEIAKGDGKDVIKALPGTIEIDGVQRSTKNSNGQPIAQTEEGTRNFWKWFGDSKEVDDQGRPLLFTHSGFSDITEIGTGENDRFNGIFAFEGGESGYHGPRAHDTSFYVRRRASHSAIRSGDFDHEKAINAVIDELEYAPSESVKEKLLDYIYYDDQPRQHIENDYDPESEDPEIDELLDVLGIEKTSDFTAGGSAGWEIQRLRGIYAKALGFDAVDMYDENGYTVLLLSGEGVKSATGNRGTFDQGDANIMYSRGNDQKNTPQQAETIAVGKKNPAKKPIIATKPVTLLDQYRQKADAVLNRVERALNPLGKLEDEQAYLKSRYLALGKIANADEVADGIKKAFANTTPEDKAEIYAYLTTRDASAQGIKNAVAQAQAVKVKKLIESVGDAMLSRGLIDDETLESHRGAYLPQLYLKWLLNETDTRLLGAGKKPSDMGYLKGRKIQRRTGPDGEQQLVWRDSGMALTDAQVLDLGPVTDPSFLSAAAIVRPMRDMALLDFLAHISTNENWVLPNSVIEFEGAKSTPQYLKQEVDRLRRQAEHYSEADAVRARALADRMDKAANDALGRLAPDFKSFKQIPNSARYGRLRGMWVRNEIYDDLVGIHESVPGDPGIAQDLLGYGGIGTKVTQLWKMSKVALNPPGQIRNFVSNGVLLQLSGVPLHKVPVYWVRAAQEIANNGKHWKIAKKYGVTESTFSAQELYRIKRDLLDLEARKKNLTLFGRMHRMAAIIMDGASDMYQFSEALNKTAKIMHSMDSGMDEASAAMEAQKWLFDYSLVSKNVRYARNAPVGVPFLTFQIKVLPRLLEVAVKHPQRFIPWVALFAGWPLLWAMMAGDDEDDYDTLQKSLPKWLQERGHALILPYKDEEDRWQVIDLGYFMPWSMYTDVARDVARGEVMEGAQTLGIFSGPITDVIVATKTNIDPFTKREIVDPGDPASRQFAATANYVWDLMMPPIFTSKGLISPMGLIDKEYGGKLVSAATGRTNKYGDPTATATQAATYPFGLNIYSIEPNNAIAQNMSRLEYEINQTEQTLKRKLNNRALSDESRTEIVKEYTEEMQRRSEKAAEYMESVQ